MAHNNLYTMPPLPANNLLDSWKNLKTITHGQSLRSSIRRMMKRNIERENWNGSSWDIRQAHKRRIEYSGPLRFNSQGHRINDDGEECSDTY